MASHYSLEKENKRLKKELEQLRHRVAILENTYGTYTKGAVANGTFSTSSDLRRATCLQRYSFPPRNPQKIVLTNKDIERYGRHLVLPRVGVKGKMSVCCIKIK